jgi:hypothetical protein
LDRDVVKRHSKMKTPTTSKLIWNVGFAVPTAQVMNHSICHISSCSLFKTRRLQLQGPKNNPRKTHHEAGMKNYCSKSDSTINSLRSWQRR